MANPYDASAGNKAQFLYNQWKEEVLCAYNGKLKIQGAASPRALTTDGTAILAAMATLQGDRYALSVTP